MSLRLCLLIPILLGTGCTTVQPEVLFDNCPEDTMPKSVSRVLRDIHSACMNSTKNWFMIEVGGTKEYFHCLPARRGVPL